MFPKLVCILIKIVCCLKSMPRIFLKGKQIFANLQNNKLEFKDETNFVCGGEGAVSKLSFYIVLSC